LKRADEIRLPPGYRIDLVSEPEMITLRRRDGSVVGRFSAMGADGKEIERVAWEDCGKKKI
jgi:hypothetical protein